MIPTAEDVKQVMDMADELQKNIHVEISDVLAKGKKGMTYQDAFNTCVVLRLAMLQQQLSKLQNQDK
jgi:hypothetical protein